MLKLGFKISVGYSCSKADKFGVFFPLFGFQATPIAAALAADIKYRAPQERCLYTESSGWYAFHYSPPDIFRTEAIRSIVSNLDSRTSSSLSMRSWGRQG